MNKIEVKPIGTFKMLVCDNMTNKQWYALCKTFGFRYRDGDETAPTFHFYDNGEIATVCLTQGDIVTLHAMHSADGNVHTLYTELADILSTTGCEKLLVRTSPC